MKRKLPSKGIVLASHPGGGLSAPFCGTFCFGLEPAAKEHCLIHVDIQTAALHFALTVLKYSWFSEQELKSTCKWIFGLEFGGGGGGWMKRKLSSNLSKD